MIAAGIELAGLDLGGDPRRRARDLLARAVVEGDDQRQPVVVLGQLLGLFQQPPDVRIEIAALADHAHLDAVLVQLGEIVADEAAQQAHQVADFGRRARPVLRAEGKDA